MTLTGNIKKVLDFEKKLENKNHQGGNLLRRKRAKGRFQDRTGILQISQICKLGNYAN